MELKPSEEVLTTLETVAAGAAQQAAAIKKAEKANRKREKQVERLRGFTSKIQLPHYKQRDFAQEDWVDVRTDDASGTTLQARRTYHQQERDHSDIDYPREWERNHRLEVRFARVDNPELATEPVVLASMDEYETHTSLHMRSELGLRSGFVSLRQGQGYIGGAPRADKAMVEQALEIEHEILDVLVAASQQPQR